MSQLIEEGKKVDMAEAEAESPIFMKTRCGVVW